jgi:hypothetical protein
LLVAEAVELLLHLRPITATTLTQAAAAVLEAVSAVVVWVL